ncbi:hypothetical protein N7454_002191 [Penicillium verhagenii]|nr:hypothetical protein N7454_002191 [Penicillium verhagenii]
MPDRRLSRLIKSKLLRRSSTPAAPNPGNGADPSVHHPISTSGISGNPHLFDSASEKSPYSVVSSAAQSTDDTTSVPDAHEGHGQTHKSRRRAKPSVPSPLQSEQQLQRYPSSDLPTSIPLPTPTEPKSSLPPTPLSEELSSPLDSPIATPQHSDDTSLQAAQVKFRTSNLAEYQLDPTLETVVETSPEDPRPSTSFPQPLRASDRALPSADSDPGSSHPPIAAASMAHRRIWVKRPGGSATLVHCLEDAVVDELRDQIITKYGNSLGRTFDSPDIVIRIVARENGNRLTTPERLLSPEEALSAVLDSYYPGGQTIQEALLIEAPTRRTPKPSPRHTGYHHHYPSEPGEHGEYFPLMPANTKVPTPPTHPTHSVGSGIAPAPSISILTTGVPPPLASPGSRARQHRRPVLQRHTTNSPTLLGQVPTVTETGVSPHSQPPPTAAPQNAPTPPATVVESPQVKSHTPPAPVASPRALRKSKGASPGAVFGGLIDGTVPPINVLIVEDNIINQKLLEAFMKRLSVRWKCAANGEEAVRKWRQGGFHLVLMDIQLPVMNGLDATKEIRRLERLNGIGVFPKTASGRSSASSANSADKRPGLYRSVSEEDTLSDLSLFRSPVIIVALTASSLQSDRHEALAAGCNDFLTKPVGFPWLSQKVTEWGCMQALIDFEGWRKWRGFMDSPRPMSPRFDSAASPMQTGARDASKPAEAPSPSITRTKSKIKGIKRPSLPDAAEVLREDSWGSGSGDTGESATSADATPAESEKPAQSPASPPDQ